MIKIFILKRFVEFLKMNKSLLIRLMSFLIALSVCLLGVVLKKNNEKNSVAEKLNYVYLQSFNNLVDCVNEINSAITKIQYTSSEKQISDLTKHISNQSVIAENELKILPESAELNSIVSFLEEVQKVSYEINELNGSDNKDEISGYVTQLYSLTSDFSDSLNSYVSQTGLHGTDKNDALLDKVNEYIIRKAESKRLPKAIENQEDITLNKAYLIVSELVEHTEINDSYEIENAELPLFVFNSDNFTFALTRQGGFPVFMCKEKIIKENNIRKGQAIEFADDFLKKAGFKSMVCVHTAEDETSFKLYYAFLEGATICYTDLVELSVSKDDGDIIYLDAFDYLYNHKERALPTLLYAVEEAQAFVSENLNVISSATVLIPKGSSLEIRCYEFICLSSDNKKILLYLNAETLEEEALVLVEE